MAKHPAIKIGLYVTEERDREFYHVRAHAVIIGPTLWDLRYVDQEGKPHNIPADRIRNCSGTGDSDGTALYLESLAVNSQGDNDRRRLYGWGVEYRQPYAVDLHRAQRMAKTLTTIDRRMTALDRQFGHPASFGAYLARVADAIGATAIVRLRKDRGSSYDDRDHQIDTIQHGVYAVDRMIEQWQEAIAS